MITVDNKKCMSCGQCEDICSTGAIQYVALYGLYKFDMIKCKRCMKCITELECPGNAIKDK